MRSLCTRSLLFACMLLLGSCGNTQPNMSPSIGSLQISDVWMRPADMATAISGAYMSIKNTGNTPDALLLVQGDIATAIELHTMTERNGVMQMNPVNGIEGIEIPANREVQLKPGGAHVMLIGLKQDLKAGDTIPLTLQFKQAGTIQVIAIVR